MVGQGRGQCFFTLMLRDEVVFARVSVGIFRHGKMSFSIASMVGVCVDGERWAIQRWYFSHQEKLPVN